MNTKITPLPNGNHLISEDVLLSSRGCDGVKLMVSDGGDCYTITLRQLKEGLALHLGVDCSLVDSYIKVEE